MIRTESGPSWHAGVVTELSRGSRRRAAGDVFASWCAAVVRVLPFRLSTVVPPSLIGFAVINGFTFGVDLLLLTLLRGGLGWPVWLAISVAYGIAFGLSFVLNRSMNFRSHAPVGRQTAWYVLAVVVNYVVMLLGVGAGLAALGVQYQLSRLVAGVCEGVFMYCAMRWVVFAKRDGAPDPTPA